MLQKVMCGYTTPISKFKSSPSAAMSEAQGEAIAVSSHNEIQFYAVPSTLFEEMVAFCEYAQRGTTELKNIPANFMSKELDMDKVTDRMAAKLKEGTPGDYDEWP